MDVMLKGVPEGITEHQVKEWVAILVERYQNQKVNAIPEIVSAVESAKTAIDAFRESNNLVLKFTNKEESK